MAGRLRRGTGDSMHAQGSGCNTGSPVGGAHAPTENPRGPVWAGRVPDRPLLPGVVFHILSSCLFHTEPADATARKKESGTGNDRHRCRQTCLDSKIGIAVLLCVSVCQRTCVKNGAAVCQAQCGPDRTRQSELPHRGSGVMPAAGRGLGSRATQGRRQGPRGLPRAYKPRVRFGNSGWRHDRK